MTSKALEILIAAKHHLSPLETLPAQKYMIPIKVNQAISNMGLGGAERLISEQLNTLAKLGSDRPPTETNLFVINSREPSIPIKSIPPRLQVIEPDQAGRKASIAKLIHSQADSRTPLICHLFDNVTLQVLWAACIDTIVVYHNAKEGWKVTPAQLNRDRVPLVIAVSNAIRLELIAEGCEIPIHVLKHFPFTKHKSETWPLLRENIRKEYRISPNDLLVGMIGNYKKQKNYRKAIDMLRDLNCVRPSFLLIVGGCDSDIQREEKYMVKRLAKKYEMSDRIILKGYTQDPDKFYPAFDVFVNTSLFEGLSLATLKATLFKCPVVSSDVGGQREATKDPNVLLHADASSREYAAAVLTLDADRHRQMRHSPTKHARIDCAVLLPVWLAKYGLPRSEHREDGVLFITSSLRNGGAQRSLTNLLSHIKADQPIQVMVIKDGATLSYVEQLRAAGVRVSTVAATTMSASIQTILSIADDTKISTICFWNVDARTKLVLAKVLQYRNIRFIDVSPGPKIFRDLDSCEDFGNLISFTAREYFDRINNFVSKYKVNCVPRKYSYLLKKTTIIPNGVPKLVKRSGPHAVAPAKGANPRHAVVTCCRLTPDKKIIELLQMAHLVRQEVPSFTLTIVGSAEEQDHSYLEDIIEEFEKLNLAETVFFQGPHSDVSEFLENFAAFVMLSVAQGCPNASLEAMAAGLPVVANGDGGTAEQLVDGITGFLVEGLNVEDMARKLIRLLEDEVLKSKMGRAGRERAESEFSMESMTGRYRKILWPLRSQTLPSS